MLPKTRGRLKVDSIFLKTRDCFSSCFLSSIENKMIFFKKFGGDVHFDDAEPWTIDSAEGTNLLQVANHEIGHSLGLSHSEETEASMSPLYNEYIPDFMLHKDDVEAIQKLYGKKRSNVPEGKSKTSEEIWDDYWDGLTE